MAAPEDPKLLTAIISASAAIFVALLSFTLTQGFALWNAKRERKREKSNVSRALLIEVHLVNEAICKRLKWLSSFTPGTWLPPLIEIAAPTYDKLRERIGFVDADLGQAIVEFHGYIHFINRLQNVKPDYESHGLEKEFLVQYLKVLEDHLRERGDCVFIRFFEQYELSWPTQESCQASFAAGK